MSKVLDFFKWLFKCALWGVLIYQLWFFAHIVAWRWYNPVETSFMNIRLSELQQSDAQAQLKWQWLNYSQISPYLKHAVIAAEDDKFTQHYGFDIEAIKAAFDKNQAKGKAVVGGSTISQQLAKNLFLSPERSYFRKGQEAIITVMIELVWDKQRILEVYLNMVEWGDGIFGAKAAAQHYYKRSAVELSKKQAARLAVMLPNPRRYQRHYPAWLSKHAKRVEHRMFYSEIP